jgi:hypothetical protein
MAFALLSVVPLLLIANWPRFQQVLALLANLRYAYVRTQAWLNPAAFAAEVLLPLDGAYFLFMALLVFQYALLGAAVAGVIAMAGQLRASRRQPTLSSPQQACP